MSSSQISDYVCTVPPKYLKIAEKQLRETELRRKQALIQLKELILKNPHIEKSTLGKFSVLNVGLFFKNIFLN